jgi:hypothetical protein
MRTAPPIVAASIPQQILGVISRLAALEPPSVLRYTAQAHCAQAPLRRSLQRLCRSSYWIAARPKNGSLRLIPCNSPIDAPTIRKERAQEVGHWPLFHFLRHLPRQSQPRCPRASARTILSWETSVNDARITDPSITSRITTALSHEIVNQHPFRCVIPDGNSR